MQETNRLKTFDFSSPVYIYYTTMVQIKKFKINVLGQSNDFFVLQCPVAQSGHWRSLF